MFSNRTVGIPLKKEYPLIFHIRSSVGYRIRCLIFLMII